VKVGIEGVVVVRRDERESLLPRVHCASAWNENHHRFEKRSTAQMKEEAEVHKNVSLTTLWFLRPVPVDWE
jgi:hypothetical protein